MLTLPYVIASSTADLQTQATELLSKTDIIASAPSETETLVDPYLRIDGKEAPEAHNILSMLQTQLQGEAEQGWPLALIPRLFKPRKNEEDLIDLEAPTAGQKHAFPTINVPQTVKPGPYPIFPELYFSVYADQDIEVNFYRM